MQKNLFIYGTLANATLRERLGLECEHVVNYDYIKGYALKEVTYEGYGTYLCAYPCQDGIISGRVLFNANLNECIEVLDEYEGDEYEREEVVTQVHGLVCAFYVKKQNL